MSDDELMIISPLDQSLDSDSSGILDWIDKLIDQSLKEHDASIVLNGLRGLIKVTKTSGLGLAKGLYLTKTNWAEFGIEDEFENVAYAELGIHRHTVDRYVDVWAMYARNAIPNEFIEQVQQQNIKAQIPIAKAIAQGYEIDFQDWKELANASDFTEVARLVREVKGKPPRKGSLQILMNFDGELKVFSDGEFYQLGWLNISSEAEPVHKAIDRIVSNGGVLRR